MERRDSNPAQQNTESREVALTNLKTSIQGILLSLANRQYGEELSEILLDELTGYASRGDLDSVKKTLKKHNAPDKVDENTISKIVKSVSEYIKNHRNQVDLDRIQSAAEKRRQELQSQKFESGELDYMMGFHFDVGNESYTVEHVDATHKMLGLRSSTGAFVSYQIENINELKGETASFEMKLKSGKRELNVKVVPSEQSSEAREKRAEAAYEENEDSTTTEEVKNPTGYDYLSTLGYPNDFLDSLSENKLFNQALVEYSFRYLKEKGYSREYLTFLRKEKGAQGVVTEANSALQREEQGETIAPPNQALAIIPTQRVRHHPVRLTKEEEKLLKAITNEYAKTVASEKPKVIAALVAKLKEEETVPHLENSVWSGEDMQPELIQIPKPAGPEDANETTQGQLETRFDPHEQAYTFEAPYEGEVKKEETIAPKETAEEKLQRDVTRISDLVFGEKRNGVDIEGSVKLIIEQEPEIAQMDNYEKIRNRVQQRLIELFIQQASNED